MLTRMPDSNATVDEKSLAGNKLGGKLGSWNHHGNSREKFLNLPGTLADK
jgi:hypothetical protein